WSRIGLEAIRKCIGRRTWTCERFRSVSSLHSTYSTRDRKSVCSSPISSAFDPIVVDTKVIDRITDHERGLMVNYLRITGLRVGLILNFKHRKLGWERIVL